MKSLIDTFFQDISSNRAYLPNGRKESVYISNYHFEPNDDVIYIGEATAILSKVVSYNPSHIDPDKRLLISYKEELDEWLHPNTCIPVHNFNFDNRERFYLLLDNPHYRLYSLMDDYILMTPTYSQGYIIFLTSPHIDSPLAHSHLIVSHIIPIKGEGFVYLGLDTRGTSYTAYIDFREPNGSQHCTVIHNLDKETYDNLLQITDYSYDS